MNNPGYYLIMGTVESWGESFKKNPPLWGFNEKLKNRWDALKEGDVIYFYAKSPAKGIIGKGIVLNKFISNEPYWPEEIRTGSIIWPWKFYFNPIALLESSLWEAGKGPISCSDIDMPTLTIKGSIIKAKDEYIDRIDRKIELWEHTVVSPGSIYTGGPEAGKPGVIRETNTNTHSELIRILEDMGKLQSFYPQSEYSIPNENRRVDVIWRREIHGVPTYAFEVELSKGLDRSLNKLYRCHQLFNALPRIITPQVEHEKIEKISSSLGFKEKVVTLTPEQIKDVYEKKKCFKDLEYNLGIL